MESNPIEEPEAIIPIEIVSSGSATMVRPTEDGEAIIPPETDSSGSTEDDEAPIPPETVSSGSPTMVRPTEDGEEAILPMETASSGSTDSEIVSNDSATTTTTVRLRRRAANRTEPLYLRRGTRPRQPPGYFASLPPPQDEDNPAARKKPRIEEESLLTARAKTRDEVARETDSTDTWVGHSPSADDDANADAVTDTQPNDGATGSWTLEEDAKLTSAVANTSKKKWGNNYKTDWVEISSLVPGRTNSRCWNRWKYVLDPSIDRTPPGRTGKFSEDEDSKLKEAVKIHSGKNWGAVAALVPGRTQKQCNGRWNNALKPNIKGASGRTGTWAEDEDSKLKHAVQTHGDKDWVAISALVPGRTREQCRCRWRDNLDPSIDRANKRTGKWTEYEDSKLRDAVQRHGGNDWGAIAALVPGRTRKQCRSRWKNNLDPSIDGASGRTGSWTVDEDSKLKDAVQTHGGKNWDGIAALVPGRARSQCRSRWQFLLR
jgi:hypothetical protein